VLKARPYADGTSALGKVRDELLADSKWAIRDLETVLIQSLGTQHRGNLLHGRFAQGERWEQVVAHEVDHYLDRLDKPTPGHARKPEPSRRLAS